MASDDNTSASRPSRFGRGTVVELGLVLLAIGAAVQVGRWMRDAEDAGQQLPAAIAEVKKDVAEKFEGLQADVKESVATIAHEQKDLRDRFDALSASMLRPADVELAVGRAVSPELARHAERLGALEEWRRIEAGKPKPPNGGN